MKSLGEIAWDSVQAVGCGSWSNSDAWTKAQFNTIAEAVAVEVRSRIAEEGAKKHSIRPDIE
jgi:hypothetical protein